jgi:uncharacterized membrane protein YjfL (UPF0719 family)
MKIMTVDAPYEIQPGNLALAVIACGVWFGLAMLLISYPKLLPKKKTLVRVWSEKGRWLGFLFFSVFGCFFALLHWIFLLPGAFAQIVYHLSLMPTIAVILGVCCLRDLKNKEHYVAKKFLVFLLMGFDMLILLGLPIIFGFITRLAISAVAILFGMSLIRVRPVGQLITLAMFTVIILGALSVRHEVRVLMCEGECKQLPIMEVFQKEKKVEMAKKPDLSQDTKGPKTHRVLRVLEAQLARMAEKPEVPEEPPQPGVRMAEKPEGPQEIQLPDASELFTILESRIKAFESGSEAIFKTVRFIPPQLENGPVHYIIALFLQRINRLGELGYVIQTTGSEISYSHGITYYPLFTKFIPRVIWAGKPQEKFGQFFGHRYRFLDDTDFKTSINMPLIAEGYMNWGWFGIVFSAMLFGIVLRLLWELWIGATIATGNVVLGMLVVMTTVGQDTNLSLLLGGLLYGGLIFWCIEAFFRKCFSKDLVASAAKSDYKNSVYQKGENKALNVP